MDAFITEIGGEAYLKTAGVIRHGRDHRDRCGKSFARYEGTWTIAEKAGSTHITSAHLDAGSADSSGA
jgi:hypothetical protein